MEQLSCSSAATAYELRARRLPSIRSTRFDRVTSNVSAMVFTANRPPVAMANAISVFFAHEVDGLTQDLDFHRFLAEHTLQLANLLPHLQTSLRARG